MTEAQAAAAIPTYTQPAGLAQPIQGAGTSRAASALPVRKLGGRYKLSDFSFLRTLGTGSFGRVHLVRS